SSPAVVVGVSDLVLCGSGSVSFGGFGGLRLLLSAAPAVFVCVYCLFTYCYWVRGFLAGGLRCRSLSPPRRKG
ncbi:hypothetical protein A2U01_0095707, partial [Trifolium medium]|nr:hypothetical protein [Trifolium medium]